MKQYLYRLAIASDQWLNALTGGFADETLSSRIWRNSQTPQPRRRWQILLKTVNTLFFWQKNHCRGAFERERERKHFPDELKQP
ncbi:MAG: hypothetical protein Q4D82_02360 [Neisseria sp.]|nr:hypothetical protein [Neisseria sp.]